MDWFVLDPPSNAWLVDGLITSDGHAAICGKPKAGKSTFVRNLIVSVIKNGAFIGRAIDIPTGMGHVLYIHLDRKDQPGRVAEELRKLGITRQESERLVFRTAQEMPATFLERLEWLQKEVLTLDTMPHLVVIDMLWQFVIAKNNNDYNAVIDGINKLQDALLEIRYKGALVITLHGRKAESPDDAFDDILGSTGQRGSFSTSIMLKRRRKEGIYTVESDQTHRDDLHGEIPERVLEYVNGVLRMGETLSQRAREENRVREDQATKNVIAFIHEHPHCQMDEIVNGLKMAKKTVTSILQKLSLMLARTGEGKKGSPYKYSIEIAREPEIAEALDNGATTDNRPYFAEQRVEFKPL